MDEYTLVQLPVDITSLIMDKWSDLLTYRTENPEKQFTRVLAVFSDKPLRDLWAERARAFVCLASSFVDHMMLKRKNVRGIAHTSCHWYNVKDCSNAVLFDDDYPGQGCLAKGRSGTIEDLFDNGCEGWLHHPIRRDLPSKRSLLLRLVLENAKINCQRTLHINGCALTFKGFAEDLKRREALDRMILLFKNGTYVSNEVLLISTKYFEEVIERNRYDADVEKVLEEWDTVNVKYINGQWTLVIPMGKGMKREIILEEKMLMYLLYTSAAVNVRRTDWLTEMTKVLFRA